MQHFYDAQIRRYLTQIVRMMSNFSYKDGKGRLVRIPVTYGDLTRQAASIINQNSENKVPSAPRMAVYITGLEMDRTRTGDSSYVNKVNIRERAVDNSGNEYLKTEGKNYTVERLMPTPYILSINVDVWSTNTDQKLQIMEQVLMLFNPSLEIQTTDNYVDWTSLSVVNLENITFSSRTIPAGTESEIDIATLGFTTPIWITPPAKVKKLGVITKIITAVFADNGLEINMDDSAYAESLMKEAAYIDEESEINDVNVKTTKRNGTREGMTFETGLVVTSHGNYDVLVLPYDPRHDSSIFTRRVRLLGKGIIGAETWTGYLKAIPEVFRDARFFENGVTQLRLQRRDSYGDVIGAVSISPIDEKDLIVNIDPDTLPTDTTITGPNGARTNIDYIVDPTKTDPREKYSENPRILLLGNVGHTYKERVVTQTKTMIIDTGVSFSDITGTRVLVNGVEVSTNNVAWSDSSNDEETYKIKFPSLLNIGDVVDFELYLDEDGPDAWKNADGSDFAAFANDIVEWDGLRWHIVFDASTTSQVVYTTNLKTNTQYKWQDGEWILSYEGESPDGTWRLAY
jgi:hypothetical protein